MRTIGESMVANMRLPDDAHDIASAFLMRSRSEYVHRRRQKIAAVLSEHIFDAWLAAEDVPLQ
jgi:hypothetical protein